MTISGPTRSELSDPQYVAVTTFQQKMTPYPKGHPLHPETLEEQAADLKTVKLADVRLLWRLYGVDHGFVSFVGRMMRRRSSGVLEKGLDHLRAGSPYSQIGQKYFDVKGGNAIDRDCR